MPRMPLSSPPPPPPCRSSQWATKSTCGASRSAALTATQKQVCWRSMQPLLSCAAWWRRVAVDPPASTARRPRETSVRRWGSSRACRARAQRAAGPAGGAAWRAARLRDAGSQVRGGPAGWAHGGRGASVVSRIAVSGSGGQAAGGPGHPFPPCTPAPQRAASPPATPQSPSSCVCCPPAWQPTRVRSPRDPRWVLWGGDACGGGERHALPGASGIRRRDPLAGRRHGTCASLKRCVRLLPRPACLQAM